MWTTIVFFLALSFASLDLRFGFLSLQSRHYKQKSRANAVWQLFLLVDNTINDDGGDNVSDGDVVDKVNECQRRATDNVGKAFTDKTKLIMSFRLFNDDSHSNWLFLVPITVYRFHYLPDQLSWADVLALVAPTSSISIVICFPAVLVYCLAKINVSKDRLDEILCAIGAFERAM